MTASPYELSHVKNEFSLVRLTACQYEKGQSEKESVQKKCYISSTGRLFFRSATWVFMFKFKAQQKERLYRSRHDKVQLKLLL